MTADTLSGLALRPYLPSDAPRLTQIFRDSIEELTAEDYDEAQRAAWISFADDETLFAARLAAATTLIALRASVPVGFAALRGLDHIDMLYIDPSAARMGVGAWLCEAVEKLARGRGAKRLTVDASDTALPFFQKQGFRAQLRRTVACGVEWLGNTQMVKTFDEERQGKA